jgi:hypothetical protein
LNGPLIRSNNRYMFLQYMYDIHCTYCITSSIVSVVIMSIRMRSGRDLAPPLEHKNYHKFSHLFSTILGIMYDFTCISTILPSALLTALL